MKKTRITSVVWVLLLFAFSFNAESKNQEYSSQLTHYIVFEMKGGIIKPYRHQFVYMAAPISKTRREVLDQMATQDIHKHKFLIRLATPSGEIVHQDVVEAPRWIRGEFPSGEGMESFTIEPEQSAFVVRVPVINEATKLYLSSKLDFGEVHPQSGLAAIDSAEASFDLDEMARNSAALPMSEFAPTQNVMPLVVTGSPANRVDLLIMGDGYTEAQRDKFFSNANHLAQNLFNISPYREYKNFVNLYALFTPSQESGADHPPYKKDCPPEDNTCCGDEEAGQDPLAGTFVQTAFDASFCNGGIQRQLKADYKLILSAAAEVPDWDRIMVIVNDPTHGGFGETGIEIMIVTTHGAIVTTAQHEYGHGFTGLGDEYVDPNIHSAGCKEADSSCPPNITDEVVRGKIKWAPWIQPETPIPTPEIPAFENNVVGLFEGALYLSQGLYRPQYHCMMRDLSEFCSICAQEYVLRLYKGGWGVPKDGIDLIEPESETPPPGHVFSPSLQSITFDVELLQPAGSPPLEVTWLVNDMPVLGANSNSFTYTPGGPEDVKVEIRVKDTTPLVHPAMAGNYLYSSRVWQVANETISTPTILNGRTTGHTLINYMYSTGGSVDSRGHKVQYLFDWGDNTDSGWLPVGTSKAKKSWTSPGTYSVKVKARCATNVNVISDWSEPVVVTITLPKIKLKANLSEMVVEVPKNLVVTATSEKGWLLSNVTVTLRGGGIELDKVGTRGRIVFVQVTPLEEGEIIITAEKSGYETASVKISVRSAEFRPRVSISTIQKTIKVFVKNRYTNKPVEGAQVKFSGVMSQTLDTPKNGLVTMKFGDSGQLTIEITKKGYADWEKGYQIN
jgi:hypothetical protein